MSYFLSSVRLQVGREIEITGEEARHIINSRRIKAGERLNIQGSDEKRFEAEAMKISKDSIKVKILDEVAVPPEPDINIVLFQAFVKEKALDYIVQKAVELGAAEIVIFESENAPFSLKNEQKKAERLLKISQEAAKQCDRIKTPEIKFLSFTDVARRVRELNYFFILQKMRYIGNTSKLPKMVK